MFDNLKAKMAAHKENKKKKYLDQSPESFNDISKKNRQFTKVEEDKEFFQSENLYVFKSEKQKKQIITLKACQKWWYVAAIIVFSFFSIFCFLTCLLKGPDGNKISTGVYFGVGVVNGIISIFLIIQCLIRLLLTNARDKTFGNNPQYLYRFEYSWVYIVISILAYSTICISFYPFNFALASIYPFINYQSGVLTDVAALWFAFALISLLCLLTWLGMFIASLVLNPKFNTKYLAQQVGW